MLVSHSLRGRIREIIVNQSDSVRFEGRGRASLWLPEKVGSFSDSFT